MSKTISFRASEELAEFLEEEAQRRMTTTSTVAQMLLAERVRELMEEGGIEDESTVEVGEDGRQAEGGGSGDADEGQDWSDPHQVLEEFDEHWYESTGSKDYAIETPGGDKRYVDGESKAAKTLLWYYEPNG